jgi:hypothetical protein
VHEQPAVMQDEEEDAAVAEAPGPHLGARDHHDDVPVGIDLLDQLGSRH